MYKKVLSDHGHKKHTEESLSQLLLKMYRDLHQGKTRLSCTDESLLKRTFASYTGA